MEFKAFRNSPIDRIYPTYNLSVLTPDVQEKAHQVIDICAEQNIEVIIFSSLRTIKEQAIFYRQSRTIEEILKKVKDLYNRDYAFLSYILEEVGPQKGPLVTNAAPGETWHNFGEAWDAHLKIDDKAILDYKKDKKIWNIYGNAIREVGMQWGGDQAEIKDYSHAHLRKEANPLKVWTLKELVDKLDEFEMYDF